MNTTMRQRLCSPRCGALPHVPHHTVVPRRQAPIPRQCASSNGCVTASGTTVTASPSGLGAPELKQQLLAELAGLDRGIFGVPAAKKARILSLITDLEQSNTHIAPTSNLQAVAGSWRLLYSTITITGSKRTKLGLREFVKLGEFTQNIDTDTNTAVNRIAFSVSGLSSLRGALTIRARYSVASERRVDIEYLDSALTPSQLQTIFEANLPLLLSIFNPEGWLEITYLDDTWRVGRDNKGNVFLLERPEGEAAAA